MYICTWNVREPLHVGTLLPATSTAENSSHAARASVGMDSMFPSPQPMEHGMGACGGVGHHGPDPLAALQTSGIWTTSGGSREGGRPIKHTSGVINRKMVASQRLAAFMYISIAGCARALTFYCMPAFHRSGLALARLFLLTSYGRKQSESRQLVAEPRPRLRRSCDEQPKI